MTLNQLSLTPQFRKLRPLVVEEEAGEEGAEIVAEMEEVEEAQPHPHQQRQGPASVVPSTLICLLVSGQGAGCIIDGGSLLIFVQNPPHVLGRTFSPPSLQNEGQTSSARRIIVQIELINYYMTWNCRKYILFIMMI